MTYTLCGMGRAIHFATQIPPIQRRLGQAKYLLNFSILMIDTIAD